MRWEKKEEIIIKLESLHLEVKDYLKIWKKTGGGTTGYKIGSVIHQIEETKKYFKEKC